MDAVSTASKDFPFDEWMKLWQTDPEAAEARRWAEVEALINGAPEHLRNRLIGLQGVSIRNETGTRHRSVPRLL